MKSLCDNIDLFLSLLIMFKLLFILFTIISIGFIILNFSLEQYPLNEFFLTSDNFDFSNIVDPNKYRHLERGGKKTNIYQPNPKYNLENNIFINHPYIKPILNVSDYSDTLGFYSEDNLEAKSAFLNPDKIEQFNNNYIGNYNNTNDQNSQSLSGTDNLKPGYNQSLKNSLGNYINNNKSNNENKYLDINNYSILDNPNYYNSKSGSLDQSNNQTIAKCFH